MKKKDWVWLVGLIAGILVGATDAYQIALKGVMEWLTSLELPNASEGLLEAQEWVATNWESLTFGGMVVAWYGWAYRYVNRNITEEGTHKREEVGTKFFAWSLSPVIIPTYWTTNVVVWIANKMFGGKPEQSLQNLPPVPEQPAQEASHPDRLWEMVGTFQKNLMEDVVKLRKEANVNTSYLMQVIDRLKNLESLSNTFKTLETARIATNNNVFTNVEQILKKINEIKSSPTLAITLEEVLKKATTLITKLEVRQASQIATTTTIENLRAKWEQFKLSSPGTKTAVNMTALEEAFYDGVYNGLEKSLVQADVSLLLKHRQKLLDMRVKDSDLLIPPEQLKSWKMGELLPATNVGNGYTVVRTYLFSEMEFVDVIDSTGKVTEGIPVKDLGYWLK